MAKVAIIEARMSTTTLDKDGEEHTWTVFAGADRDGAHVTIFHDGPEAPGLTKHQRMFKYGDGDFDNPLVSAVWDLMGIEM